MDYSLKIDFNEVKQIVLDTIRTNVSPVSMDLLLDKLKTNYSNVNPVHLRYKLRKVMNQLKNENVVQEIEQLKLDFGQNVHCWAQNVCLTDLNIIKCLRVLDQHLEKMLTK